MAEYLDRLQGILNFRGCGNKQFAKQDGMGRIGTTGFVLGLVGGVHLGTVFILIILGTSIQFTSFLWSVVSSSIIYSIIRD